MAVLGAAKRADRVVVGDPYVHDRAGPRIGWADALSVSRSEVPGDGCVVIAMGHIADVVRGGSSDLEARVMLRFGNQNLTSEIVQTSTTWHTLSSRGTTQAKGAIPFMAVWQVPAGLWVGGSLNLSGNMYYSGPAPSRARFTIDAPTMIVLGDNTPDLVYTFAPGPWALNYGSQPPHTQLLATGNLPWSTGTDRWVVFHSCRARPLSGAGAYQVFGRVHPTGSWSVYDNTIGFAGDIGRNGILQPVARDYVISSGHFGGFDVSNGTTSFRMQGYSGYTGPSPAAEVLHSQAVCFRLDGLDDGYDFDVSSDVSMFSSGFPFLSAGVGFPRSISAGGTRTTYVFVTCACPTLAWPTPATPAWGALMDEGVPATPPNPLDFRHGYETPSLFASRISSVATQPWREGVHIVRAYGQLREAQAGALPGQNLAGIGFALSNDGDETPPQPPTLTRVVLTPQAELDAGQIVDLSVDPHEARVEWLPRESASETLDGYRVTTPWDLRPRRRVRLSWLVDAAALETLVGDGTTPGELNDPAKRVLRVLPAHLRHPLASESQIHLLLQTPSVPQATRDVGVWHIEVEGLELGVQAPNPGATGISVRDAQEQIRGTSPWVWLCEVVVDQNWDPAIAAEAAFHLVRHTSPVVYDGLTFSPFPISIGEIESDTDGDQTAVTVTVDNLARQMSSYWETGDGFTGRPFRARLVNLETLDQEPLREFRGIIRASPLTHESISFMVELYDFNSIRVPQDVYDPAGCQLEYGGPRCRFPLHLVDPLVHDPKFLTCPHNYVGCDERGEFEAAVLNRARQHPYLFGGVPGTPSSVRK